MIAHLPPKSRPCSKGHCTLLLQCSTVRVLGSAQQAEGAQKKQCVDEAKRTGAPSTGQQNRAKAAGGAPAHERHAVQRSQSGPIDGKQTNPTALQRKIGINEWNNTFLKDGYELVVTYNVSSKKVIDFFLATNDPSETSAFIDWLYHTRTDANRKGRGNF